MSEFRPDHKIVFLNMFYTKCINVIIYNIGHYENPGYIV